MKKSKHRSDWIVGLLVIQLKLNPTFEPLRLQIYREIDYVFHVSVCLGILNYDAVPYLGGIPAQGTNPVGQNVMSFEILENVPSIIVLFSQYKIGNALIEFLYNFYLITARNKGNHVRISQLSASVKP